VFTSLHTAKKVGAISFDWSNTAVIVSGLRHIVASQTEVLGVALVTSQPGDVYRTEIEYSLAIELGIVTSEVPERWLPEELR